MPIWIAEIGWNTAIHVAILFLHPCFCPNEPLPVLLMERMEYNLHSYLLDTNHFSLTIQTKLSILCDIANGLTWLYNHKPPIIHRDLTANNVLLDSGPRAKIADFGNSEILSSLPIIFLGTLTSLQQTLEGNEALNEMSESSPSWMCSSLDIWKCPLQSGNQYDPFSLLLTLIK